MKQEALILVATDVVADADLVRKMLLGEFSNVLVSTDPARAVADFEVHRPGVLVLAFDTLEKAERYYLGLYRLSKLVPTVPHRTLILCGKNDLTRVYELCRKEYFYDYVLFWPLAYDAHRLPMALHQAFRDLAAHGEGSLTVAAFAAQTRRLGNIEPLLDQHALKGSQHLDLVGRSLQQAQQDIGSALDGISRKLAQNGDRAPLKAGERAGLAQEISRLKTEAVHERLQGVGAAIQPAQAWAGALKHDLAPQLKAIDALNTLARRVPPVVLVVEDDEFQRKLLARILAEADLESILAASGTEALAMLNKKRPDLILMDLNLPDIGGLEVTRRLKSVEHLARIPVVVITGESGKGVVVESLNAGAADFVVKPVDKKILLAKVLKCIAAAI